jgi:hypothetical protein
MIEGIFYHQWIRDALRIRTDADQPIANGPVSKSAVLRFPSSSRFLRQYPGVIGLSQLDPRAVRPFRSGLSVGLFCLGPLAHF